MKNFLLLIIFLISNLFFTQEMMNYKNKGNKIEFKISTTEFYAKFSEKNEESLKLSQKDNFQKMSNTSALLPLYEYSGNFSTKKQKIANNKNLPVEKIEPVLIYKDGTRQIVDGQISIKANSNLDVKSLLEKWNFKIERNEFDKNVYILTSNSYSTDEIFKIVNELQNNKNIEFAEPNFIRLITPNTSDPYFNSQWAIKNQGYNGGTVGADMKVENAWNYVTGSGIKVAIIDEGVDLVHPDLANNMLSGYDATGNNSNGAPSGNDAHGTACAGIVAAIANNNIGTAGVAYNTKILPVRIAYGSNGSWVSTDNGIANGINWAWQNGADVLSNSWGGGSSSSTIINAINNAVNNGRNGKGCVVLFSTGNHNTSVSFPANQSNVIAVGASNMFDERKSPSTAYHDECWYLDCHGGSNYGAEVDVVAPGVMIATSDISGSAGYSSGDYYSYFNGTSSACPNAAGVVALILSANPNLTQAQARAYLEKNADKVLSSTYSYQTNTSYPNGTWNNQTGYGRVNALKAVEDAFFANVEISGISSTCNNSQITFNLSQVPTGYNPVWSYSSNLTKISESSSSIVVAPNNTTSNTAWIKATFGTKEIIKTFWIGNPKITVYHGNPSPTYNVLTAASLGTTASLEEQGLTPTSIVWKRLDNNTTKTGFTYEHGGVIAIDLEITATNSCGSYTMYDNITPSSAPCDDYLIANNSSTSATTYIIIDPCANSLTSSSKTNNSKLDNIVTTITNMQGNTIINTSQLSFKLDSQLPGTYYAVILKNGKIVHKQTLIKK